MAITEELARQALEKIKQLQAENQELRARLGEDVLGDAIGKSLRNPVSGQPRTRNRMVSDTVRDGIFKGEKPVSKATKRQTEVERKRHLRRDLEKAQGIRPFRKD